MAKPLPYCICVGEELGPALRVLAERGHPVLGDATAGARLPTDSARVVVLVAPQVAAAEVAALDAALPSNALVVLLTHHPGPGAEGADGFLDLLGACQKLATGRRVATLVAREPQSLTALVSLVSELDDHTLVGPGGEASDVFVEARAVAVRAWWAGKDATLVTGDVSGECLAGALGLSLAGQLAEQLLEPDPVSGDDDTSGLVARIPAYVKEAGRPLRAVLESMKLELAPQVSRSDPLKLEAELDLDYARVRTEIGRERLQLLEQGTSCLDGDPSSSGPRGLLAEIDSALAAQVHRSGLAGAVRSARALEAIFKGVGAGSPPMQLAPRIAALENQREAQRQRARDATASADAAESVQTVAQILKLERAQLLGGAAAAFWKRTLEHLARRTAEYERLAAGLTELQRELGSRLSSSWARLGVAPRDASVSRFMRAHHLARTAVERAVLPGTCEGDPAGSADEVVQALTSFARAAIDTSRVPAVGAAAMSVASQLEARGLLTPCGIDGRLHEQIIYGAGAEQDARKLALSLDTRPRSIQVDAPGTLAWVRLSSGLPLRALARRLGLATPETSDECDALAPLGEGLTAAAARAAYATACEELARGRHHEAIAAYRQAVSAAGMHKDPLGPVMAALMKLIHAGDPHEWARSEDGVGLGALETARPEEAILGSAVELAAALQKLRELEEDSSRVFYVRDAERRAWELAETARSTLAEPERTLLAAAFERFGSTLRAELGDAYGKASVLLNLTTARLSYVTKTRVEVKLVNVGHAEAHDLRLRVVSAERMRLLSPPELELGKLASGVESVLGFDVKPLKAGTRVMKLKLSFANSSGQRTEKSFTIEPELVPVRTNFERIELNPFVAGPPIQSAEMFFGRQDVLDFVVSNLRGQHQDSLLLLHGARRTGKSSIFYRLGRGDLLEEYVPVYLDLQGLGDFTTESLLSGMARRIVRAFKKQGIELELKAPHAAEFAGEPFETFMEFLEDFEEAIVGEKRGLVLIDEFEILESKANEERVSADVFPFLRSVTQHSASLSFILAGTRRLDEMDERYWSVFYGLVRDRALGFLDESEMRALVTRPLEGQVEVDDLALEAIYRLTSGHPYYTQLICQTLVSELNRKAERNFLLLSDVLEAARMVLSLGGGQITHEWASLRTSAKRLTLAALAELALDAAVWVERDELAARLEQSRAGVSPEELGKALAELARRELVTTPSAEGPVRFRMDLLRQWVRQEKPVSAVMAESER